MGKLKCFSLVCALLVVSSAKAGVKVVIDPWTTEAVTQNTASQGLIEDQHNTRVDSVNAKQQKIMQYTTAMQTIKELYVMSMQNVTGFGEETKYYSEIFSATVDIFRNVPVVLGYINSSPVKNYILCVNEMADVVAETQGLVADFINIVNNAKISVPGDSSITKNIPLQSKKSDGYNFLDRYERLTLANNIYSRLLQIKYKMEVMAMTCQFCNGISDVLFAIDPESWAAYFTGKNIAEGLVNDWNNLGV
jgi:hypothetical protein